MKSLNPRTPSKNPKGWIGVFDAFRKFRNVAASTGEPVQGWALLHGESFRERRSKGWEVRYSIGGTHHIGFVGHDARTAILGIEEMIRVYPMHKRTPVTKIKLPKVEAYDPKFDPNYIRRMFQEWSQVIKQVGHTINPLQYEQEYAPKFKLLKAKAGILNMDMRQYLTNHPHAEYWPVPPTSEAELQRRNTEFQRILQQREARRQQDGFR